MVPEAIANVQSVAEGTVSELLRNFLRVNVPHDNSILGVSDESIGKSIKACEFSFDCIWHGAMREVLRVIRQNFSRLIRSLITQPGDSSSLAVGGSRPLASTGAEEIAPGRVAESRARLIVSLSRARFQLNLPQHLADTAVIRALTLIDDLDMSLTRSAARLRKSYATHFPEACQASFIRRACLNDMQLVHLIAVCPTRSGILQSENVSVVDQCLTDGELGKHIRQAAGDSIGSEFSTEDANTLQKFAQKLLSMMQMRQRYLQQLAQRIDLLVPNLHALLKSALPEPTTTSHSESSIRLADSVSASLVAARLIVNAGSLTRLANMPTTRVLSLGASKALFRKSGAVAATATGLLSTASQSLATLSGITEPIGTLPTPSCAAQLKAVSADRLKPDLIRRRAARLLAAKAGLACKADCFRSHNPAEQSSTDISGPKQDPRLVSGTFGVELGRDVQRQLRTWAETNGVHLDRTPDQRQAQRQRRKKYRKMKRKAWMVRKLSRSATGQIQTTTDSEMPKKDMEALQGGKIKDAEPLQSHMDVDSDTSDESNSDGMLEKDESSARQTPSSKTHSVPVRKRSARIRAKQQPLAMEA